MDMRAMRGLVATLPQYKLVTPALALTLDLRFRAAPSAARLTCAPARRLHRPELPHVGLGFMPLTHMHREATRPLPVVSHTWAA